MELLQLPELPSVPSRDILKYEEDLVFPMADFQQQVMVPFLQLSKMLTLLKASKAVKAAVQSGETDWMTTTQDLSNWDAADSRIDQQVTKKRKRVSDEDTPQKRARGSGTSGAKTKKPKRVRPTLKDIREKQENRLRLLTERNEYLRKVLGEATSEVDRVKQLVLMILKREQQQPVAV